ENATYTNHLFQHGLISREELERKMNAMMTIMKRFGGKSDSFKLDYKYEELLHWLQNQRETIKKLELDIPDSSTVKDELRNTLRLIELGMELHRYIFDIDIGDQDAEIAFITHWKHQLETAIAEFRRLWLIRNREGGLISSLGPLYKLLDQFKGRIEWLQTNNGGGYHED